MRQVTLVSLYGSKPQELKELIIDLQSILSRYCGSVFSPYEIPKIHATIVGLERLNTDSYINSSFAKYRNKHAPMDFQGFLQYLQNENTFPIHIQFGGFQDREYPFKSFRQRPYDRSFQFSEDKAILMGWPIKTDSLIASKSKTNAFSNTTQKYSTEIADFRKSVEQFNILHKYHRDPTNLDNDFYLRIGTIDLSRIKSFELEKISYRIKEHLAQISPITINVSLSNLLLVSYLKETFPDDTTKVVSLKNGEINQDVVLGLYSGI